ncbi:single-stranded DNA-binding protein [Candidatus Dojkabacteria bacterium]|nr:single-stranded DNA-binding protein [Candidatus Dojkabacteria bacterium]
MATRSLNKVILIGNLTRDPEIRYTSSGAGMCTFGVATNRSWKDAEGNIKEEAEFHNVVAWNKMAEVCYQLLAKGMKVYVEGELRTRTWEDDSGETKYRTEIKLNEMILLDSKGKSGVGGGAGNGEGAEPVANSGSTVDAPVSEEKAEVSDDKSKEASKSEEVSDDDKSNDPLEDELPF